MPKGLEGPGHDPFVAKARVDPYQPRTVRPEQSFEKGTQPRQSVAGGMGLAVAHFDIEDQTDCADPVGMQNRARAPRFVGIVADLSALSVTVEGFDGRVAIENPGGVQGLAHTLSKRPRSIQTLALANWTAPSAKCQPFAAVPEQEKAKARHMAQSLPVVIRTLPVVTALGGTYSWVTPVWLSEDTPWP